MPYTDKSSKEMADEFVDIYLNILQKVEASGLSISTADAARTALDIIANLHGFDRQSPDASNG
ncbi:MAG TPA: hypothetical protein EYN91_24575 [Candidatus Melainabacteria bacterium]|nr:hypothetical protein [Cyanobacteria bacterium DS2.3.42]HIA55220.1 hypothetical protein [Candidatus Melainabacteria bacterium]